MSLLALILALAACGTGSGPTVGHLAGVVYIRGGTINDTPIAATLTATPTSGDASHTYTTDTAKDGTFSVDLPQGTYELTGTLTKRNAGGKTSPQDVTITPGQTTRVAVYSYQP